MGGDIFHDQAHTVSTISKTSFCTKPTVISSFSTTASFQLRPTVILFFYFLCFLVGFLVVSSVFGKSRSLFTWTLFCVFVKNLDPNLLCFHKNTKREALESTGICYKF